MQCTSFSISRRHNSSLSHSRCTFSRILGIFSMILPPSLLNHMSEHMLFGDDGVNSFENIPNLLGKSTPGMALSIFLCHKRSPQVYLRKPQKPELFYGKIYLIKPPRPLLEKARAGLPRSGSTRYAPPSALRIYRFLRNLIKKPDPLDQLQQKLAATEDQLQRYQRQDISLQSAIGLKKRAEKPEKHCQTCALYFASCLPSKAASPITPTKSSKTFPYLTDVYCHFDTSSKG